MVFVVIEVDTVVTVLQFVFSYPLAVYVVISSLRCYTSYLGVLITQINLEPLVHII